MQYSHGQVSEENLQMLLERIYTVSCKYITLVLNEVATRFGLWSRDAIDRVRYLMNTRCRLSDICNLALHKLRHNLFSLMVELVGVWRVDFAIESEVLWVFVFRHFYSRTIGPERLMRKVDVT